MSTTPPEDLPVVVDVEPPPDVRVDVEATTVQVSTIEQTVQVTATAEPVHVHVEPPASVDVVVDDIADVVVKVADVGEPGPPGPALLIVSATPPTDPDTLAAPYLRAEVDPDDGHLIRLWLGVPDE